MSDLKPWKLKFVWVAIGKIKVGRLVINGWEEEVEVAALSSTMRVTISSFVVPLSFDLLPLYGNSSIDASRPKVDGKRNVNQLEKYSEEEKVE